MRHEFSVEAALMSLVEGARTTLENVQRNLGPTIAEQN